jgi:hypothetical protein
MGVFVTLGVKLTVGVDEPVATGVAVKVAVWVGVLLAMGPVGPWLNCLEQPVPSQARAEITRKRLRFFSMVIFPFP